MTNNDDRQTMKTGGTTYDRGIIGKAAIAMQFYEFLKQAFDEVEGMWPV